MTITTPKIFGYLINLIKKMSVKTQIRFSRQVKIIRDGSNEIPVADVD